VGTTKERGKADRQKEVKLPQKEILHWNKAVIRISKAFGTIEWENGADIAPEFIEEKLRREDARTCCS
jgi:hypothetical protein